MTLSFPARVLLALAVLVGALVYALVVDLGWNAGRVHRGVDVVGYDVGGLTEPEAVGALQQRGEMLRNAEVRMEAKGIEVSFLPWEVGWKPRVEDTARRAMAVGRRNAPFVAVFDRARAYFSGVTLKWAGKPQPEKVTPLLDRVERQAESLGYSLNRERFQRKIRRAIMKWPRRVLRIPIH